MPGYSVLLWLPMIGTAGGASTMEVQRGRVKASGDELAWTGTAPLAGQACCSIALDP